MDEVNGRSPGTQGSRSGLAAVITDGLTNSRLDVYELDTMRRLPRREGWSWPSGLIVGRDGRFWFDIPDAVGHFLEELRRFEPAKDISCVVPVARGATVALIDRLGRLLPREVEDQGGAKRRGGVISYLNAAGAETDAIFDGLASPRERYRQYGLPPNFANYAIPARTIVALACEYPELLSGADSLIFGPEIIARLFLADGDAAESVGLELTYLMCHTGLWKDGQWSSLARAIDGFVREKTGKRLIGGLMPEVPRRSSELFGRVGKKAAAEYGLDENAGVLIGGHDSTLADVPVVAAFRRAFGEREFIHFQGGSWGMARVIGRKGPVELPVQGFGKNVMYQGDLDGNPVLTASVPTGIEFQHYGGDGPGGKGELLQELHMERLPLGDYHPETMRRMLTERSVFVTPGVAPGIGPYPRSVSAIHGRDKIIADQSGELAYIALNLETSIMATASIELVAGEQERSPVVLSAGASADPLFRLLVATLARDTEIYYVADERGHALTETTTDGGLLLAMEHVTGNSAYDIDVSGFGYHLRRVEPAKDLVESLLAYRSEFEKRADPGQ
jgi:hypothetical protein